MDLIEAIEERRARIAQLQAEVDQLEQARQLVAGVLGGESVKPPPRAVKPKERAVRIEALATGKRLRTKPGDPTFGCGHERSKENTSGQGKCRACKNAYQTAWNAKRAAQATKTKAEPDPVRPASTPASRADKLAEAKAETPPGCCVACDEPLPLEPGRRGKPRVIHDDPECKATYHAMFDAAKRAKPDPVVEAIAGASKQLSKPEVPRVLAEVKAEPVTRKPEGLVLDAAERERLLKAAQKWKGQCSAVDTRGQRCGLLHPHEGPHNASGRPFTTVVPAGSALPRRELDELAMGSRP